MLKNAATIIVLSAGLLSCSKEEDSQVYAGFDVSQGPYVAPCNIIFYNQSQNADTYFWDFGDGSNSAEISPEHVYSASGFYTVILRASNGSGSKSYTRTLQITEPVPVITAPPDSLGLDPFYKKYTDAFGIPVISSDNVPDEALIKVMEMVNQMMQNMPEVREKIISYHGRVGIMSEDEVTTDIPEHAFLANDTLINWDERARGLGGTVEVPITTCAEENVLCYDFDPYHNEDIFIHEFAHTIHLMGLQHVYPDFNNQLISAYNSAISAGKWVNTYAATNMEEYWAEGVQDWFNCNNQSSPPDGVHNHVNTRTELKDYDPVLYSLIETYFPSTQNSISCHNYD